MTASYEGYIGDWGACGIRVNTWQLATASHYPCGTRITIRYGRHVAYAVTEDHGPYVYGRSLDIWDATARRLGFRNGDAFGVRRVLMTLGWPHTHRIARRRFPLYAPHCVPHLLCLVHMPVVRW